MIDSDMEIIQKAFEIAKRLDSCHFKMSTKKGGVLKPPIETCELEKGSLITLIAHTRTGGTSPENVMKSISDLCGQWFPAEYGGHVWYQARVSSFPIVVKVPTDEPWKES